jgi:hypothetical protein
VTARFTQEDPIGLAGGINLYGFAAGDPVNFDDPFGLCPEHITGIPCAVVGGAWGGTAGLGAGLIIGGAGGTLVLPGGGTVVGAAGVGAVLGAAGAITGAAIGTAVDAGFLLARGRLSFDPDAIGPHSVFKRNPQTRQVDKYDEFHPNPQNPKGFDRAKSFQRTGRPHTNKVTKRPDPTPHVNDPKAPGGVAGPSRGRFPSRTWLLIL